jgi:DNA helicase-2/ATP-dependent DNA helicase PcrA
MDGLSGLNASQRDAVLTSSGPLLVLAGAGTGKTRVITYRMAELIRRGTPADRILSVTFTNKAAKEMQQRTTMLLGRRLPSKPVISTFHSLCVRVLREDIEALDYPSRFTIFDRGDQESAARTALRDIRVGETSMRSGDLLSHISRWKMNGIAPSNATDNVENDLEFLAAVAYRRYQSNLRAAGAVDFDDLILLTNQLFSEFPEVLERHQRNFDQVQIDEYQDTNGQQFQLVEALVREHQNLCVVGDDDQSIYGWRGADVRHILGFQSQFPGAKVVRLQDNYRCTDKILELANRLVRHNVDRHEKTLTAHKASDEDVRFLTFPEELGEAEATVREISYLHRSQEIPLADFAILFRTNEQPRLFESELRRAKLRYVLVGGQSFFDRREIRDVLAYLKTLANPSDEMSLLRIINTPARGIGTATVEKLLVRAVRAGKSIWSVIPAAAAAGELAPKTRGALEQFHSLLEKYRQQFDESPNLMPQTLTALLDEIDYDSEISKQYKDSQQQLVRSGMLEQMIDAVTQYVERSRKPSLFGFLEDAALMGRDDENDDEDRQQEDAMKLMTLHSAKGLEFPRVYLVGMEEGFLPHHRSIGDSAAAIAEERRLAYVGITRAEDHLTLSRAESRMKWGRRRPSLPSRFLFEMRGEDYPEDYPDDDLDDDLDDEPEEESVEESDE